MIDDRSGGAAGGSCEKIASDDGVVCLIVFPARSNAAEIRVLGTKSTKLLIEVVRPLFEQQTGNRIDLTTDLPVATKRKIDAGEAFDVAILSPPLVSQLIAEGKIVEGTQANIVRVGVGLGVREGAPVPDISSVEAFKSAMLAARSIAYLKEGNTGLYLAKLFEKLGIADQLKSKTTLPMLDVVSELVAKGEVERIDGDLVAASRAGRPNGRSHPIRKSNSSSHSPVALAPARNNPTRRGQRSRKRSGSWRSGTPSSIDA